MSDLDAPVAILGFGRFGRALGELIVEHDLDARAFDNGNNHRPSLGRTGLRTVDDGGTGLRPVEREGCSISIVDSVAELVDGARLIILATPVSAAKSVLRALRPHLSADHLVIDVASVKAVAVRAMTDLLGADIPWIATHPLFGPASIARAEHLHAVVCPNDAHPAATNRAAAFYERLGCDVTFQSADEHDRTMACTHALAFFVAKGMLDIGAGQSDAPAPPSFSAMAQTIETVRADAGHLFYAIQHDNPHAAQARRSLLDSLARIHDQIESPVSAAEPAASSSAERQLTIAPGSAEPDDAGTREFLREIDNQIADLRSRRIQIETRAQRFDRGELPRRR